MVLKIDTKLDTCCLIGPKLVSGRHRVNKDGRYKYLGSALGPDGLIYMFPCDAERVLCIDPRTDSVRYIGPTFIGHPPALRTSDRAKYESTVVSEDGNTIHCIGENKWQNGFAAKDGCIYAIPQRAPGILRIAPVDGGDAVVSLVDCGEAFHGTLSVTVEAAAAQALGRRGRLHEGLGAVRHRIDVPKLRSKIVHAFMARPPPAVPLAFPSAASFLTSEQDHKCPLFLVPRVRS